MKSIFGLSSSSAMEAEIEKATSEKIVGEKWGMIMDICDKIGSSSANAKESLRIIIKRLNHQDPHVVVQAITLLDACVNNCGKNYCLEIASREFEQEFRKLLQKSQPPIANKLKQLLKKWAEGDFKKDPQLNLIPSMYNKLKHEGVDFSDTEVTPKREVQLSKDPNVVSSQQEEDDIAKAIELSLKEKTSPKAQSAGFTGSSLYPSVNSVNTSTQLTTGPSSASAPASEQRKVRALYDFEAAEDNELTFKAGEIIMVIEESDPNWWRGSNHRGEGFFPANFVSADLTAEPENLTKDTKAKKLEQQFSEESRNMASLPIEVNEDSIDRLLFLLHEADPSDPSQDSDEMLRLENVVNQMGPLIDSELERVDRKHAQLTQLSSDLIDTINLYHSLMRETERAPSMGMYSGYAPHQMYAAMPGAGFSPSNNSQYRMQSNMIPPPGMMMPGQFPTNSANLHQNFQSLSPSANFPMPGQNQMMASFQQMQIGQPQMMQGQQTPQNQQQIPVSNSNFPPQQNQPQPQQQVQVTSQQNGIPQQPYQIHPNQQVPLPHPNMQLNHIMGNLNLQSPPVSMQGHQLGQMPMQQGPGMQITQPMTFNLQSDSNQNIPVYQQQR